MQNLRCYKQLPEWTAATLPAMFQEKHNTKEGTWAKLTILSGELKFYHLDEQGNELASEVFNSEHQPPFIEPQLWHKVEPLSDDLRCQLSFYCEPDNYYVKKYNLTAPHSAVRNALTKHQLPQGKVLDLGSGRGRNALYLADHGFDVLAVDANAQSVAFLEQIAQAEQIKHIQTQVYDINQAAIQGTFDLIVSTVVMMFLDRNQIPAIIHNMQQQTASGGYNLIVCAMHTEDYPCTVPFSFTFAENELKNYYQDWTLLEYDESLGELHKTDENGQRIKLKFVTMLAQKR